MPVLCDFTVIQDGTVIVGDSGPAFSKNFSTGGVHNAQALLMINVQGLTDNFAQVIVNGLTVKGLMPSPDGNSGQWFSQHMVLPSSLLSPVDGNNKLEIKRVLETGGGEGQFDDFNVRDIVCFFHQST
jgi:hypothetical protein